jgi:hypothetical protein
MATTYELWDTETRNLVAEFPSETAALAAVRRTLAIDGRASAETLLLGFEDDAGEGARIAAGAALIALALQADTIAAATAAFDSSEGADTATNVAASPACSSPRRAVAEPGACPTLPTHPQLGARSTLRPPRPPARTLRYQPSAQA